MATYLEIQELINDGNFRAKIKISSYKIAGEVLEDPNRADEHAYFQVIRDNLNNPGLWLEPLVGEVAMNATIQLKNITNPAAFTEIEKDTDIEYVLINEVFPKFSTPEPPVE